MRRFIEGKDTQRGYCQNISVMCRLQVVNKGNQVICGINTAQLSPIEVSGHGTYI